MVSSISCAKAIVPGRAFTRRMYSFGAGLTKPHHHFRVTSELKFDLEMWMTFLSTDLVFNRPFLDLDPVSEEIPWATDASANPVLGAGGTCGNQWFILQWDADFILRNKPSINFLELFAVAIAVLAWLPNFTNRRITILCDNMSVVYMLNSNTSKCKRCMVLLRIIVLQSLIHNVRLTAKHVTSENNKFPDLLSRLQYKKFRQLSRKAGIPFANKPTAIDSLIWPMHKVWL